MFYWLLKFVFVGPFLHLYNRPKLTGAENVPTDGAFLIVANHLSVFDWLHMPLLMPRRVTFLAKSEYFERPGIIGAFQKFFFSASGQYPIDRTNAEAAQAALDTGEKILRSGKVLCIFPEGTRSPDGRLYRGKTGPARLALKAGVPIVPIGIVGTDKLQGKYFMKPRPVSVRVGEPLDVTPWKDREGDRAAEREITNEFMDRIHALTGQEYEKERYGADVKKELEADQA